MIFVASPRKFEIKVYKKELDNSLTFLENIYCGTGVDNIEFDLKNNLWVGAHPNLYIFRLMLWATIKHPHQKLLKFNIMVKTTIKLILFT